MSKHTPGKWSVHDYDDETILVRSEWSAVNKPGESSGYGSGHGLHIANLKHQDDNPCVSKEVALANAARIVACVNALKDFSTSDLEAGIVGEMVRIIKEVLVYHETHDYDEEMEPELVRSLEAFLSKIKKKD